MVSKNNFNHMMQENSKRVPHYGLRKLSVGVASVLLGATLYFGGTTVAHADPVSSNDSQPTTAATTDKTVSSPSNLASNKQTAQLVSQPENSQAAASATSTSQAVKSTASSAAVNTNSAANDQSVANSASSENAKPSSETNNQVQGTYSMSTDAPSNQIIGGVGAKQIQVKINAGAKAGDVITISGDEGSTYGLTISDINPDWATVEKTEENGKLTAKITFKENGSGSIYFYLQPKDNWTMGDRPIKDPFNTEKNFTLSYNGKVQDTITLKQTIKPTWKPKFMGRVDQNANEFVFPGQNVTYQFAVNEATGIDSDDYYATQRVNASDNYGTVITIPMPTGFVLDVDATKAANNYNDQTTITQQGDNIIINVPKGSGSTVDQRSTPGDNPYAIVGHYNFVQDADNPVHQANGPITITQKNSDNDTHPLTWATTSPISEKYAGKMVMVHVSIKGVTGRAWTSGLLPQNGEEQIVNYFSFANGSFVDFNNGSAHLTMRFPDGLDVDKIKTPKLNGTTSYKYTMTLSDGTTQTGTVNPGDFVTANGGFIKEIEFTPDNVAGWAQTDDVPDNLLRQGTQAQANVFEAYGKVADKYSNGQPVKNSDPLKTTMKFTTTAKVTLVGDTTFDTTQQVVTPTEQKFTFFTYGNTKKTTSGTKDAFEVGTTSSDGSEINTVISPIFYVVAPAGATFDQTTEPTINPGTPLVQNAHPRVSYFMVGNREVAKIDLSDYKLDGAEGGFLNIQLNSGQNMLNGNYYTELYVVSPQTAINADSYADAKDKTKFKGDHDADNFNPAWLENNTAHAYLLGEETYTVNEADATKATGVANGNQNSIADKNGSSLNTGDKKMTYKVALKNGTDNSLSNAQFVINLPQESNSSFHFQMNGAPDLSNLTGDQLNGVTIKYSNQLADLSNVSREPGAKFNESGYVTADNIKSIGGWSAVKSIVIDAPHVNARTIFGNIILNGQDENLLNDSGKTGTVSTGIFADDLYAYTNPDTASISVEKDNSSSPIHDQKTVTRTIIVTDPITGKKTKTVQTVNSTRQGYSQNGTDHWDPWTNGTWAEFDAPTIDGYQPSQAKVAAMTVNGDTPNVTVNITYSPVDQSGEIQYVIKKSGKVVGTTTLTGKVGENVAVVPVIPDGYIEDEGQNIPATVKATANGIPTVTVYVTLKKSDTPDPANYSEDSLLIIEYKTTDGNVLKEDTVAGKAGQAVKLNFAVPDGYHAVAALPSTDYTFTGHDDPIIIIVAQNAPYVPDTPVQPTGPTEPVQPTKPVQPTNPQQPTRPTQPQQPTSPAKPTQPKGQDSDNNNVQPTEPVQPTQPSDNQPVAPDQPAVQPKGQTTDDQTVKDNQTQVNGDVNSAEPTMVASQSKGQEPAASQNNQLPQTGNNISHILAMIGLSGLIAALDFVINAKKRREK